MEHVYRTNERVSDGNGETAASPVPAAAEVRAGAFGCVTETLCTRLAHERTWLWI